MSGEIEFVVPGKPMGEPRKRVRVVNSGGRAFAMHYPAKEAVEYRARITEAAARAMREAGAAMIEGACLIQISVMWELPQSKWKRKAPVPAHARIAKPDADNVAKIVCDALNGVVFRDDSQVACLTVAKINAAQGETGRLIVLVAPIT